MVFKQDNLSLKSEKANELKLVKKNNRAIGNEKKIYINSLTPNFSFNNHKGNKIVATNCIFL